jgi:hypothetical protein
MNPEIPSTRQSRETFVEKRSRNIARERASRNRDQKSVSSLLHIFALLSFFLLSSPCFVTGMRILEIPSTEW